MKKYTEEMFLTKANNLYGNRFDYSNLNYIDSETEVSITCLEHQTEFIQKPKNHLRSVGFKQCSYSKRFDGTRDTLQSFISKANKIHKNKYDYSKFNYVNSKTNGTIICNTCSTEWLCKPNNHLSNQTGCPNCSENSIYTKEYYLKNNIPNHECYLYLITFVSEKESFIKIGITKHNDINQRFKDSVYKQYKRGINIFYATDFFNAYELEQFIINKYKKQSYIPLEVFKGRTECFNLNVIDNIMLDLNSVTLNGNIHDKLI